jgi:hypothetical protein
VGPASLQTVALAVLASLPIGIAMVMLCTLAVESYGAALFLGAPFLVGTNCAFALNRAQPSSLGTTLRVAGWTVVAGGGSLLLFAVEGALCVAMALPLAVPVALAGAGVGRYIALHTPGPALRAVVLVLVIPGLAAVETAGPPPAARSPSLRPGTSGWASPIRSARCWRDAGSAPCAAASSRPAPSSSRSAPGTSRGGWPSTSPPSRRPCAS